MQPCHLHKMSLKYPKVRSEMQDYWFIELANSLSLNTRCQNRRYFQPQTGYITLHQVVNYIKIWLKHFKAQIIINLKDRKWS